MGWHLKKAIEVIYRKSPKPVKDCISFFFMYIHGPFNRHGFQFYYLTILQFYVSYRLKKNPRYQIKRLQKHLQYASKNVSYYQKLFQKLKLKPEQFKTIADLQKLPILTKKDVREHFSELVSPSIASKKTRTFTTSGSTGAPQLLVMDRFLDVYRELNLVKLIVTSKIPLAAWRVIVFTNAFPKKKKTKKYSVDMLSRTIALYLYDQTEEDLDDFLTLIATHPVGIVAAPASLMYQLALHAKRKKVNAAFTVYRNDREMLYPFQRKAIETVFGCSIVDRYSVEEFSFEAIQYSNNDGFMVHPFLGILEIVDEKGNQLPPGKIGRVVGTGLISKSMPLIRYDVCDIASYTMKNGVMVLSSFEGRAHQVFRINDSIMYPTELSAFIEQFEEISESRFIKKNDTLIMEIIPFRTVDTNKIATAFKKFISAAVPLKIHIVKKIPRTKGGKFLFVDNYTKDAC